MSDDNDDDVINKNAKKAKHAHIADDDDANVDPLKDATEDIDSVLLDADAEDNKEDDENSFHDLSHDLSQQNVDDSDGHNDDMSNAVKRWQLTGSSSFLSGTMSFLSAA